MADIKLASGFVFDVTNLYGPGKVTEEEVAETNALLAEMNGAPRTVTDIPEEAGGMQV